jgi:hypothetical protein
MPTIPASQVSDEEVGQILNYLKSVGASIRSERQDESWRLLTITVVQKKSP